MTNFKAITLGALILSAPALAHAVSLGDVAGTTDDDITAMLTAQGYEVLEIEREDDEIEVELLKDGVEIEAEIDPVSGQIVELELDDEDEDNDDNDDA